MRVPQLPDALIRTDLHPRKVSTVRRDARDHPRRQPDRSRLWVVAVLAVVAALGIVEAGAATPGGANAATAQTNSSPLALTVRQSVVPETTITQSVIRVERLISADRPTATATVLLLVMIPLLVAGRRPANSDAVAPRRFRAGRPHRRGPPAFLAR